MRGKTAKKLRKLAKAGADEGAPYCEYKEKVVKTIKYEDGRVEKKVQRRIVLESVRFNYQRLKRVWRTKQEQLNEIYRGL
jgi:hypothetical protein